MKFKLNSFIGDTAIQFEDEAANMMEFIKQAAQFMNLPAFCQNCKGKNLKPHHRVTKEKHDYYYIKCQTCDWEFKYGQNIDKKSIFAKGWERPYNDQQLNAPPKRQSIQEQDVPF